ncbi:MAG: hypothetical protein WA017_18860 [Desulfosalsimonadaceae bacterium]
MNRSISIHAKKCCSLENQRLIADLDQCELNERTAAGKHSCYRNAAKKSGMAAKSCMIG